jgi:hypothetical protein
MPRVTTPGSYAYRRGSQDEWQFKNRIFIGQIASVDEVNGRITVRTATGDEEFTLHIPLYGFSIRGLRSSWIRYMPQTRDYVKIGFGPDNRPEILGYAAWGDARNATNVGQRRDLQAPHNSAYASIAGFAKDNVNGMQIFRQLKQGEWDMRSSGGAELYGTRDGALTLAAGGGADIRLNKLRQEIKSRTRLTAFENDGVEFRFGNVKRLITPLLTETEPVVPNPAAFPPVPGVSSTLREYKVSVGWPNPVTGASLTYWDMDAGTVTNGVGLPVTFTPSAQAAGQADATAISALPLMYRQRIYSGTAPSLGVAPNLTVQVDSLGNVQVELLPTAFPVGLATTAYRQYHHAISRITIAAASPFDAVFLGSEGAEQSSSGVPGTLGTAQAYVLGTAWDAQRSIMNQIKVAQHGAVSSAHGLLAGAFGVLGGAVTAILSANPTLAADDPPLFALLTALSPAVPTSISTVGAAQHGNAATAETAIATAIQAFETAGEPTGYLSKKVFGE